MTENKPFSTARFLSRHEIDQEQIKMVLKWQISLENYTRGRRVKIDVEGRHKPVIMTGKLPHFRVELIKVNKWLKQLTPQQNEPRQ